MDNDNEIFVSMEGFDDAIAGLRDKPLDTAGAEHYAPNGRDAVNVRLSINESEASQALDVPELSRGSGMTR